MIDDGIGATWARALQADHRSLKFLTEAELQHPFILHKIQQWHGCTMGDALEMRGAECRRRTTTTDFNRGCA